MRSNSWNWAAELVSLLFTVRRLPLLVTVTLSFIFCPINALQWNRISLPTLSRVDLGLQARLSHAVFRPPRGQCHYAQSRKCVSRNPLMMKANTDSALAFPQSLPKWLPAFSTACLGGLLFGLDIGSSSTALRIFGSGVTEFGSLDALQLGQVASAPLLGAIVSSATIAVAGDKAVGRKQELQAAALLFAVGTALQSQASSFTLLMAGRILYGLGIGTAMHAAPLFIAETAPNGRRGQLISLKEAAIVLGIVCGYGTGAMFGPAADWRGVFLSAAPFEALMLLGALAVPESPRWLALRNRPQEATEALLQLQAELTTEQAAEQVQLMVAPPSRSASSSVLGQDLRRSSDDNSGIEVVAKLQEIFDSRYNRRALLIGVGLVLFQQLSGQPSVLYFANRIFEGAGLGFEAAVGVGVFKLAMTFLSAALVENPRVGRKTLLLVGNTGVAASLLLLAYLYAHTGDPAGAASAAAAGAGGAAGGGASALETLLAGPQTGIIICILAFVGFYQIGFGPITWLVLSEVFPLAVRSSALSLGTLANFSANLLVALVFEAERAQLGESALFLQFGLVALVAVAFTYAFVFETRGLSLEQIERKLEEEVDRK